MSSVVYEVDESVATVRLNRPDKLNAFTYEMIEEIRAAVDQAAGDERVVGVIITGAGRGFCAGLDAADLARSAAAGPPRSASAAPAEELPALFSYLLRVPKPVLAAVNGVAAGGGFVLAMMCDLRFASEDGSFTTIFSRRGLIAEHGTSWLLPRLVGTSRALDLLWSARRIDAAEAFRIGFVDRVVPRDRLLDEASAYVRDLAAGVSRRAIAVIKEQVYRHLALPLDAACRESERLMLEALAHPDATEGAAALLERRAPRFAPWKGADNR
jgi:enoyl-CoA hydratase/carnithine racemase